MNSTKPRYQKLIGVFSALCFYIGWFWLTRRIIRPIIFPPPEEVIAAAYAMRYTLLNHVLATLSRILVGFGIGAILGVLVGLFMSWNPIANAILNPHIQSFRPVPPTAIIPFFILWFGIGVMGKVLLISIGTLMILVIATLEAIKNVPPVYIQAAQTLGADRGTVYKTVILPAIIPHLIGSFRVSIAMAYILGIAAELMGAQVGLGFVIMVANRTLQTETILLGILIIGGLAALSDKGISVLGSCVTRWVER